MWQSRNTILTRRCLEKMYAHTIHTHTKCILVTDTCSFLERSGSLHSTQHTHTHTHTLTHTQTHGVLPLCSRSSGSGERSCTEENSRDTLRSTTDIDRRVIAQDGIDKEEEPLPPRFFFSSASSWRSFCTSLSPPLSVWPEEPSRWARSRSILM